MRARAAPRAEAEWSALGDAVHTHMPYHMPTSRAHAPGRGETLAGWFARVPVAACAAHLEAMMHNSAEKPRRPAKRANESKRTAPRPTPKQQQQQQQASSRLLKMR